MENWFNMSIMLAIVVLSSNSIQSYKTRQILENSKIDLKPRIINGTTVDWTDGTRYQVSLRLKSSEASFGVGHMCGGALIGQDVVLTAAHCLWNSARQRLRSARELQIVMGNLNRFTNDDQTLVRNVSRYRVSANFKSDSYVDDLAVLLLEQKVPSNYSRASVIELNVIEDVGADVADDEGLTIGQMCSVTGWGVTETGSISSQLKSLDIPILNRTICVESYGQLLRDEMFCAGYTDGQRDACAGDSGGPLVCDEKLFGIVSFGTGCAIAGFPGVYVNVAKYNTWVQEKIQEM